MKQHRVFLLQIARIEPYVVNICIKPRWDTGRSRERGIVGSMKCPPTVHRQRDTGHE
jgi:hypothetical protein